MVKSSEVMAQICHAWFVRSWTRWYLTMGARCQPRPSVMFAVDFKNPSFQVLFAKYDFVFNLIVLVQLYIVDLPWYLVQRLAQVGSWHWTGVKSGLQRNRVGLRRVFSRMRSEGSRFIWGSGGEAVFAESCVGVRNRPQPFATVCMTVVRLSTMASASGVVPKACEVDPLSP